MKQYIIFDENRASESGAIYIKGVKYSIKSETNDAYIVGESLFAKDNEGYSIGIIQSERFIDR
jgi:hypothetical protein